MNANNNGPGHGGAGQLIPVTGSSPVRSTTREGYYLDQVAYWITAGLDKRGAENMADLMTQLYFGEKT